MSAILAIGFALAQSGPKKDWPVHSLDRPLPAVVDPGPPGPPAPVPSDAIVLFDGTGLSGWTGEKGGPARWRMENGYMEVAAGTGSIKTVQGFGDCQLHVEWASPAEVTGEGQDRGNSGVYLMDTYEVQVLDCYNNTTYADGTAAAIYGQYPPLVNACRKPGEWQTYDIIFHAPRFGADKKLVAPARITVLHNGVLVQDNVTILGPTTQDKPEYAWHPDRMPIQLQDHNHPVRYRNIWLREIK
jgi:hypothetical protein